MQDDITEAVPDYYEKFVFVPYATFQTFQHMLTL